jgi:hypothetical protein
MNRHNLVIKQPIILRLLGSAKALSGILIHHLSRDPKIPTDVLARPAHRLHTVRRLLALRCDELIKRLLQPIPTNRHLLRPNRNAHIDAPVRDLVRNVGRRLEARRAEAVHAARARRVGEARRQRRRAQLVGRLAVRHVAQADVLHEGRIELAALAHLLQQRVHHVLERRVLEAAFLRLGQGRANRERDDDVVGILGGAEDC